MVGVLFAMTMVVQDSGAFLVRLGTDTLVMEQYTRSASQLRGEYVIRSPRTLHRIYTADLNPDGSIRRYELVTHNISVGPGPTESKESVVFSGDSAFMTTPKGDSTVTQRITVPKGTWPYGFYDYSMLEQMARLARSAGKDSVRFTALTGADQISGGSMRRRGGDTLVYSFDRGYLAGVGPFTFTLDRQGHITWLTGKGSTVQIEARRVPSVPLAEATRSFAQRPLGQLSPRDTTRASFGSAAVWVDYSRPMKRGREIFGNVVPWNVVWRTGANAATQFNTTADLVIGGATVPTGKYTLWTLPTSTGWKLIINKQTGQWGTEYDQSQDLARVDAKVETLQTPVEQLVIAFEPAALTVSWDKTKISVPVSKK